MMDLAELKKLAKELQAPQEKSAEVCNKNTLCPRCTLSRRFADLLLCFLFLSRVR